MLSGNNIIIYPLVALALSGCIQTEIIPDFLVPEITITPASISLLPGETYQINAVYTDQLGENQFNLIQWESRSPSIVSVSSSGIASALVPGQTWILATAPGGITDSVLVTVPSNSNEVANVVILTTQNVLEAGAKLQLVAGAYNTNNQEIPASVVIWSSSNPNILTIDNDGIATGVQAGTVMVSASVEGVTSLALLIQVISPGGQSRTGMFSGNAGYAVSGTATLQQTGASLSLKLESDFMSSNGPQLGVFLATTASGSLNSQNSRKLSNLTSNTGTQTYNVPSDIGLTDYNYVVIYCIPFNVRFGTAQLN